MEKRTQRQVLVLLAFSILLFSCTAVPEDQGDTAMTGEPVNITLKGQKEMCEREPESILCKDDE
jgi:hypothetical protein